MKDSDAARRLSAVVSGRSPSARFDPWMSSIGSPCPTCSYSMSTPFTCVVFMDPSQRMAGADRSRPHPRFGLLARKQACDDVDVLNVRLRHEQLGPRRT